MKVAVVGANGQLGVDVMAALEESGHQAVGLTHQDVDVADAEGVQNCFRDRNLDAVINTAAMHNVDACEVDPRKAYDVNAVGARNLARAASEQGFRLLHVSTDYVFDGAKTTPYLESDRARPLNVYGNSKLAGEFYVEGIADLGCVVRTSGLYGYAPCRAKGGANFVELMLRLAKERGEVKVVADEVVSPTFTQDLGRQLVRLSESKASGLFHATSQGDVSWHDFAREIFSLGGVSPKLNAAMSSEFPRKTPRPSYSVLQNARLHEHGIDIMPHWHDSLKRYFSARA